MPDDQRMPRKQSRLSKQFKEFSFDDVPASPQPQPLPPSSEPVKLTKEDMDFKPYRGMGGSSSSSLPDFEEQERIEREEADMWAQRDHEQAQERAFEAAGAMFRHNRPVTSALSMLSNLEMQSIITAGILAEQYEGSLPQPRVNDMMIAALALNAANFDEICGELTPECVMLVDDLRMMAEEPDRDLRLLQAQQLETDSKRVLLAMTISDLEMSLHEMAETGEDGPTPEEMADIAAIMQAIAPGVDKNLRHRAVDIFNRVSAATNNGATLKETPEGPLVLNDMPDFYVPPAEPQQKKTAAKSSSKRKPRR